MQQKYDTSVNWAKATNFIPKRGEIIVYTDLNGKIKVGDGVHNPNNLPFSTPPQINTGTAEDSLIIGEGTATAKHAIAGGTTDKSMITDLVGSVAGALVSLEPANAQAVGSLSFGASTDSVAAGAMSIGVESVAGCLGYYIWDIDFSNKKITLSKNQHTSLTFTRTKPSNLTWAVNDMISIFYNTGYYECSKITAVDKSNGTITVDSLSIEKFEKSLTYNPHDISVYVPQKPTSGEIQLGFGSYARGYGSKALGVMSNAIGYNNIAVDTAAFVTGRENVGSFGSLIGGYQNKVLRETGFAVGKKNTVNANNSMALGSENTINSNNSVAEGYGHTVNGVAAHAEGSSTIANGETSHTEGQSTKADGYSAHAEGNRTWAKGSGAHAEGYRTTAYGSRAHSEGESTTQFTEELIANRTEETTALKVIGAWDEAENANKFSMAFGTASHAEGKDSLAIGSQSHAEGLYTKATGKNSHSEGEATIASNSYAHAEGYKTEASGAAAHAEGGSTKATNETAHAEGQTTIASGKASHAEGRKSIAEGNYSHAEGDNTIARTNAQHVQGKWNDLDNIDNYAHIIGGGDSENNRKNIHTVDWSGNAVYAGEVTASNGRLISEEEARALIPEVDNSEEWYIIETSFLVEDDYVGGGIWNYEDIPLYWPKVLIRNYEFGDGTGGVIYHPYRRLDDSSSEDEEYQFINGTDILTVSAITGEWNLSELVNEEWHIIDVISGNDTEYDRDTWFERLGDREHSTIGEHWPKVCICHKHIKFINPEEEYYADETLYFPVTY